MTTMDTVPGKLRQLWSNGMIAPGCAMLFSDDGSKDATREITETAHAQYPSLVKAVRLAAYRGKEYALWAAGGDVSRCGGGVACNHHEMLKASCL